MGFDRRQGTGHGGQLGQEGEALGGEGGTRGRTRRLGLGHRPCVSAHTRKPRAAEPGECVAARLVRRVGGLPRRSPLQPGQSESSGFPRVSTARW